MRSEPESGHSRAFLFVTEPWLSGEGSDKDQFLKHYPARHVENDNCQGNPEREDDQANASINNRCYDIQNVQRVQETGGPHGFATRSGNPVFCSATASLTAEFTDWRGCSCAFLFLAL